MKPTVPGIPASASIAIVIGHASHGRLAPNPASVEMSSSPSRINWAAMMTANAARFMNR